MTTPVPASFLFRYTFPIRRIDGLPRGGKRILDLPADCRIADPAQLDEGVSFGDLRLAWNPAGLAISVTVSGKTTPTLGDPDRPLTSDVLRVWIDTRDTQSIHRASRFCHQFHLFPTGGGTKGESATGVQLPVPRAREDAPISDPDEILVRSELRPEGYLLEAWLSSDVLNGYEPESQSRLGFFYELRDMERGRQTLSVGEAFPYDADPSLWSTLELTSP